MSGYHVFADYYDALMNADYKQQADFLQEVFTRYDISPEIVLDLACGTGNLTGLLAGCGYDMIGVDASADMLAVAMNKCAGQNVLFLNQRMENLDLYGTVDAAVCFLDSLNHLTSLPLLKKAVSRTALFLHSPGLFVFDLNSAYKFETQLLSNAYTYRTDKVYCVWESLYHPETRIADYHLDFFEKQVTGLYQRREEDFKEKCFELQEVSEALEQAGLVLYQICDGYTLQPCTEKTLRYVFVAGKK